METKWYVLFTKAGCERRVEDALRARKIVHYLPLKTVSGLSNKRETVQPLIPSYVFVKTNQSQHAALLKIAGTVGLVYWRKEPVIINAPEIEMMQRFLSEHADVSVRKIPPAAACPETGDTTGAGQPPLISIKNETAKIILSSLGYIMTAEVKSGKVRIMDNKTRQPKMAMARRFFNF